MAIRTQAAPKPPVDPAHYAPSTQVRHVMTMIVESRYQASNDDRSIGFRHALNSVFRQLVELETGITDPDDLDVLCGDLIEDRYASLAN